MPGSREDRQPASSFPRALRAARDSTAGSGCNSDECVAATPADVADPGGCPCRRTGRSRSTRRAPRQTGDACPSSAAGSASFVIAISLIAASRPRGSMPLHSRSRRYNASPPEPRTIGVEHLQRNAVGARGEALAAIASSPRAGCGPEDRRSASDRAPASAAGAGENRRGCRSAASGNRGPRAGGDSTESRESSAAAAFATASAAALQLARTQPLRAIERQIRRPRLAGVIRKERGPGGAWHRPRMKERRRAHSVGQCIVGSNPADRGTSAS